MDQNRRRTDLLTNLSDHDLLIKNTVKVESLHEKIDIFISLLDSKTDSYYTKWVVSILVLIIVSISGAIWQLNNDIAGAKSKIAVHTEILKDQLK